MDSAVRSSKREMNMITNLELNEAGAAKWNAFFAAHAGEKVQLQAATFEMLDCMAERAGLGESFVYELGAQYTNTGRPQLFTLTTDDVEITEEVDE